MAEILPAALAVAALVVLGGIFVAAEFALLGARRSQLEPLAQAGRRGARHVLALSGTLRSLDRSLTTAQLGITLVALGLGMYGEHAVADLLRPALERLGSWSEAASHGIASALALAGLTYLHIVLGETLPKAIALQYPVRTALKIQLPLRVTKAVLAPFIFVLDRISAAFLRLLGVNVETDTARVFTADEIEALIEESGSGGVIGRKHAEILLNLMEFHDLPVRKLMVPRTRVVGLEVGTGLEETLDAIRRTGHTRYPVFEADLDHVLGFLHAKDLLRAVDRGGMFDLRDLSRPVPHVPEAALAGQLLREFRDGRVQIAVVVDEHGGTAGIATLEDLIEEIFGEVQDEFDVEAPKVRKLSDSAAIVDGGARVDEVNEALGLQLPEGLVDTVGGLVLHELGRTARPGDEVSFPSATLRVEAVRGLAVARIRLTLRQE